MANRKWMTKKGKRVPMRGGLSSMKSGDRFKSIDREMMGKTSALGDKKVLPDGNLMGRKLGELGGQFRGKPIVPRRKGKQGRGESGFGI